MSNGTPLQGIGARDWWVNPIAHVPTAVKRWAQRIGIAVISAIVLGLVLFGVYAHQNRMDEADALVRDRWRNVDAARLAALLDFGSTRSEPVQFPVMPDYVHFFRARASGEQDLVIKYNVATWWTTTCYVVRVHGPDPNRIHIDNWSKQGSTDAECA
jgi:hypothetical protein